MCKVKGKNPTNLKQYLKKKHKRGVQTSFRERRPKVSKENSNFITKAKCKQMTIANMFQTSLFPKESKKYKDITTKLAVYIGTPSVPYNLVENFCDTSMYNTTRKHLKHLLTL